MPEWKKAPASGESAQATCRLDSEVDLTSWFPKGESWGEVARSEQLHGAGRPSERNSVRPLRSPFCWEQPKPGNSTRGNHPGCQHAEEGGVLASHATHTGRACALLRTQVPSAETLWPPSPLIASPGAAHLADIPRLPGRDGGVGGVVGEVLVLRRVDLLVVHRDHRVMLHPGGLHPCGARVAPP